MNYNAYYNGIFTNIDEISIPLSDRSVFFGDGIYDAAIGRNGKIFMCSEHIRRFMGNAQRLSIPISFSPEALGELLHRIVCLSHISSDYFVYFQLSRYSDKRIHSYPDVKKSNFLVTVSPITLPSPKTKLRLITYPDIRYELCDIKTINLLPAVLASKAAERQGANEAVLIKDGIVTECAHSNVHIVKRGKVYTHPVTNRILPGISRAHLLEICKRLRIPAEERAFTEEELKDADEILVTSTSKLCQCAVELNGTSLPLQNHSIGLDIAEQMLSDYKSECGTP